MTRKLARRVSVQKILGEIARSSALLSLLVLSSCAGSGLGTRLGQRLEPDPQLAKQTSSANNADGQAPDAPTADGAKADSRATDSNSANEADASTRRATQTDRSATAGDYIDIDEAPEEVRPYLSDLLALMVLTVRSPIPSAATTATERTTQSPLNTREFRPNQAATRREYARWLLAVNNRFYQSDPNRKIRAGVASGQPVFQDVPSSDPDFTAIQGLAEAGIIPSPLTGSSTTLTFRPDAPLTRKDLLLWKLPLDTRQPLPSATTDAIKQAWSFQDADKIDSRTAQSLLADYQLGDFSNMRRAFGYTTLFQPDKAATRAETAAVLWRFGNLTESITAAEVLNPTVATPKSNSPANNSPTNNSPAND